MLSRIFVIILLGCTALPAVAGAAGLTFGAAPGSTRSLETEHQARALVEELADALDEDLKVRLFDDQEQIGQWLNQFAMLDLAVMDEAFLARHPGEFLVLGPVERGGALFIVARQGATGSLPQQVARILRRDGGMRIAPAADSPPVAVEAPRRRSAAAPPAPPLTLGFVTGRAAVFASSAEAEQFATRLGERLGTPVRARLFDSEQGLADWFLRFRMIDLAVINEPGRRDPLIGDYRQLERLTVTGGGSGLLVARRDLPPMRLDEVLQSPAATDRPAAREAAPVSPVSEPPLPAAPPVESPIVAAVPAPAPPEPPERPVWPDTPPALPAPELPAIEPVPVLPPLPPALPVAESPPPAAAEPVAALPPEPEPPAAVPSLLAVTPFEMPASIGPFGDAGASQGTGTLPASIPLDVLPEAAVPVAAPPTPAPEVVEAPAPEIPAVPAPAPPAAEVTATNPESLPELPFTPEPPRVIEAAAVPEVAATTPPAEPLVETAVVASAAPETVPVVTVAPAEPVSIPPAAAEAPAVAEELTGLPFIPVPPRVLEERPAAEAAPVAEESLLALAGADKVPDIIAQPDLPQELRPPGVPLPRPGRVPKEAPPTAEPLLLAKLEKPLGVTPKPPPLLPEPDAEPGVVYVAPFITLMVPNEVRERIFDQFIDTLNQRGAAQKLKFVILKQGLEKIDRNWLVARKYALGEIYGYVEDSGCCSTDLRTRARLTFYRAHQPDPVLKFEYPVRIFFDHDRSTLAVERQKLADQIAAVLVDEMFKALQP